MPISPRIKMDFQAKATALLITAAFACGIGASQFLRPRTQAQAAAVPFTDYCVTLPEGETVVTVSDPRLKSELLNRLVIERHGDVITGIPQSVKHIAPRAPLSTEDASFFRHTLRGIVFSTDSAWRRANRIREWLAGGSHRVAMPGLKTRVPREAYEQMRQGKPVLCGNLAEIYVAFCEASGLIARTVSMSLLVRNGLWGSDAHVGAEVWVPEMGGWIYQDPTFNCYWEVDGRPASTLLLHNALLDGRAIHVGSQTRQTGSLLRIAYIDPRLFFRCIYYEYQAGGTLLYYADERLEPINLQDRNWIQTDNRADIERLDSNGNEVMDKRAEISGGIFVRVLGQKLFVHDRRSQNRGIRVRSSSGAVEACAYEHQTAEGLGLFNGTSFVRNGSFNLTGKSGSIAADWSVAGPVEGLTLLGGQGIAALPGGRLWQYVRVRQQGQYLLYAEVSVTRGTVLWSISDHTQGIESRGAIEPGRISEVVSDVVASRSGYLDVTFEVPEGGAFRVIDVVVHEIPTIAHESGQQPGFKNRQRG